MILSENQHNSVNVMNMCPPWGLQSGILCWSSTQERDPFLYTPARLRRKAVRGGDREEDMQDPCPNVALS